MPYKDKEKEKARGVRRRAYFRERYRSQREPNSNLSGSPNSVGALGEKLFLESFPGAKWVGLPHDGFCCLGKVDIKTSRPVEHVNGRTRWKFHLIRQRGVVDNFILFCLEKDLNVAKVLVVPDKELQANNITILTDTESKYDKYRINL